MCMNPLTLLSPAAAIGASMFGKKKKASPEPTDKSMTVQGTVTPAVY